jgi:hypothetical protein
LIFHLQSSPCDDKSIEDTKNKKPTHLCGFLGQKDVVEDKRDVG